MFITVERQHLMPLLTLFEEEGLRSGDITALIQLLDTRQHTDLITIDMTQILRLLKTSIGSIIKKKEYLHYPRLFFLFTIIIDEIDTMMKVVVSDDSSKLVRDIGREKKYISIKGKSLYRCVTEGLSDRSLGPPTFYLRMKYLLLFLCSIFFFFFLQPALCFSRIGCAQKFFVRSMCFIQSFGLVISILCEVTYRYLLCNNKGFKQFSLRSYMDRLTYKIQRNRFLPGVEVRMNQLLDAFERAGEGHICIICHDDFVDIAKQRGNKVWRSIPYKETGDKHSPLCDGVVSCFSCYDNLVNIASVCPVCRHPIEKRKSKQPDISRRSLDPEIEYDKLEKRIDAMITLANTSQVDITDLDTRMKQLMLQLTHISDSIAEQKY